MADTTNNTNNTEHPITLEQTNLPAEIDSGNSNKIKFHHLSPENAENYDLYSDAFDNALENNNIANIAVTGPYASGKSSIMQACKEKYGEDKFITLSLTNFTQENNNDKKEIEENLEAQLVNQLIHKIDKSKIQESRFLISHKIDSDIEIIKNKIYKNKKLILLLITSIVILSFNGDMFANTINLIEKYFSKYINIIFSIFEAVKLIAIFVIAGIVIKFFPSMLYQIISLIKKNKFRRINLYGNEIELFNNEDNSIFDKYTDEILYLFKNAGVRYFIFEDIDRYEDVTIFKKLREINILLNETLKREDKEYKPIKFIYLICDNMFTAEERTKFFDFIIPVVPFIHKGNSYDYMIKELFVEEAKNEKNKKFLIKLSLFIDNARILKNIANEYYIYNEFIHLKEREPHTKFIKLLSLIIYKNLFPKDFNLLYFNKGYLAELLNEENIAHRIKLKYLEEYIKNDIIKNPKKSTNEHIRNQLKNQSISHFILINLCNSDDFFIMPNEFNYIYNSGYFALIKFLILNSYIDVDYNYYLSFISTHTLSYNLREFIKNIYRKGGVRFYDKFPELEDKNSLVNLMIYLDEDNLKQKEILNIDLFKSLILHNYTHEAMLIINGIHTHERYDFILYFYRYLCTSKEVYKLISGNFFMDIKETFIEKYENIYYSFHYFYNQYRYEFYILAINFIIFYKKIFKEIDMYELGERINPSDIEKIKSKVSTDIGYIQCLNEFDTNNELLQYKNHVDFDVEDTINTLYDIGIIFNDIRLLTENNVFTLVKSNKMFQPTYNNVVHILKKITTINHDRIKQQPYTYLLNSEDNNLIEYVHDNIIEFIESCPKSVIRRDRELKLFILYSQYITEEDREELKTRFHLK